MYIGVSTDKGRGHRPAQPPVRITPDGPTDDLHTLAVAMVSLRNAYQNPDRGSTVACEYDPAEEVADRRFRLMRGLAERRQSPPARLAAGLVVDHNRQDARIGRRWAGLTPTEFKLLACLARSAGYVIGPAEILRAVWQRDFDPEARLPGACHGEAYDLKLIRVNTGRIRARLVAIGGDGLIETRWGSGYLLRTRGGRPRRRALRAPRPCPVCGVAFQRVRWYEAQHYCSRACQRTDAGPRNIEANAGWKRQPAEESA